MATSGTIWAKQVGTRPRLSIYWKAVRQDIPNNRTEVEATLRLHSTYSLYFSTSKSGSLDGTAFTYTGGFSGTGQVNLSTKKFWVNHSSDGTKTQSINGSFNIAVSYSGTYLTSLPVSGNMSLERIPRGSTLNSASITALKNGTSSTLTIGRTVNSSSFYHLVTIQDGSTQIWSSGYVSGAPSTTHAIPSGTVNTMLNSMSEVTSKSYTVRLRTYTGSGGSGLIGDVSRNMTVSVHSDVKPSVNKPSVSISGNRRDKSISKYVQSFSKVEASVSGSAGYGASVRTYSMTVRRVGGSDSQSISGSKGTTSRPVALSGNYEVIGTVTDTRGRSNTNKTTFTVDAYSPPAITSFTAVRNVSSPTRVNITRATTHSTLGGGGNNNLSYSVQRRIGTGSWTNVNTNGSGTITSSPSSGTSTSTGNSVTSSYEFRYVVTDQFGGRAESVANITTQRVVLDIHKNEGVGIGKIHERGVLDVNGTIYTDGEIRLQNSAYPENEISLVSHTLGGGNPGIEITSNKSPHGYGYIDFNTTRPSSNETAGDARILVSHGNSRVSQDGIMRLLSGDIRLTASREIELNGDVFVNGEEAVKLYSNSLGNYIRFYNGIQICWTNDLENPSGMGYIRGTTAITRMITSGNIRVEYPAKFVGLPAVTVTGNVGSLHASIATANGSNNNDYFFLRFIGEDYSTNAGRYNYIAIGRWK